MGKEDTRGWGDTLMTNSFHLLSELLKAISGEQVGEEPAPQGLGGAWEKERMTMILPPSQAWGILPTATPAFLLTASQQKETSCQWPSLGLAPNAHRETPRTDGQTF